MSETRRELVDWGLAERVAQQMVRRHNGDYSRVLANLQVQIDELVPLAEGLVASSTGLQAPAPAVVQVVDRDEWVRANIVSFRTLLHPLLDQWGARQTKLPSAGAGVVARVAGVEMGTLLGWMAGRVLGQYDLLVVGGPESQAAPGTVYLVGPNLLGLERRHGFPAREFRLWVTLHELTHRAQFEGVPWLRPHFLGLAREAMAMAEPDPARIAEIARQAVSDRDALRRRLDEGGLGAVFANPDQREALQSIGGLMALLEGHGDVTMDRAGVGHLPSAARFGEVLRTRRQPANPLTRFIRRLIGLEAKLAQYHLGEQFIAHVERVAGPQAIDRCWEKAEHLPTLDEIRQPQQWLDRMGLVAAA